jgi:acyl-[acyl-carrier-protein] desaturase
MNYSALQRKEVMNHLEQTASQLLDKFLNPVETNWQPADMLPDATSENFFEEVKLLQERAKGLSYDLVAVLVGDMITEEALPTYESWLAMVDGISVRENGMNNAWFRWLKSWTAEENRHGDLLNKYLYLSGRVNMREIEVSTQYLIADGFDIQTGGDPYRNFVYTSFQELATQVSHRRVAILAKEVGDTLLHKMCSMVASDEGRHAAAYSTFIEKIFEVDPNEMMLAFEDMMKKKIVMPAHFLRETGTAIGSTFKHFTDAAQRIGVYTTQDYIEIMQTLLRRWKIDQKTGLNEAAQKAQDYLLRLPERLTKIAERMHNTPALEYKFKWINA